MSRAPRGAFALPDPPRRRLNTYVQTASAAGLSMLALAAASEAKVVHTETHQVTHIGAPLYYALALLPKFSVVSQRDFPDLLLREFFRLYPRRATRLAEETIQTGRRYHP